MSTKKTFRVPSPETALEFTGERFTTLTQGEVRHEHLHRYFFSLQFCGGKKVLDIASGEGYGSALLATVAREVIGVDVAAEAIQHAADNYAANNLTFLRGEATDIPVPTGSIDVVVSFETLEHVGEQNKFLQEIQRVLRPGGMLVMSTPDHEFFAFSPPNPFHVKELGRPDFESLLGGHFKNSIILLQSSLAGSLIAPDQHGADYEGFRRVHENVFESAPGIPAPMYMIGVASDGPVPEVRVGAFDDREFQLGLYAELQRRHIEMLHWEADVEALRVESNAAAAREAQLAAELAQQREQMRLLRKTTDEASARASEEATRLKEEHKLFQAEADAGLRRSTGELRAAQADADNFKARVNVLERLERQLREEQSRIETEFSAAAASLAAQRDDYRKKTADLREEVDTVKGSLSWLASAPLRWLGIPAAKLLAASMKLMYATPAFAYTGKPLARLLSGAKIPGAHWLLPNNPLFDTAFYKHRYPDAARGSRNAWAHYLAAGSSESRDPHPLFKNDYYKGRNPDVAASGINALIHYLEHGAREGRDPSPDFDTSYYVARYPDVLASGMNPLLHFITHGRSEGRQTSAAKAIKPIPVSARPMNVREPHAPVAGGQEPFISVLMPTFNTPARYLRLAVESVLSQSYQDWELCIYDDGSSLPETLETLREYRGRESRIRVEFGDRNRGIATATNQAMGLAQGRYITMLDHDDEITPDALMEVANVLNGDPAIDALYTDQAYIEADGSMGEPFYKPDWSPEMFRGVMFAGHLLVVRRSLAEELGGFDARFDRVQDFEFMLRVSEKSQKIHHLAKVLYFWRRIPGSVAFHGDEKGPIEPIQASAVNAHLKRMRIPAIAEPHPALAHRLTIKPAQRIGAPSVSIIVRSGTNRDSCVASILERSTYTNFKIMTEPGSAEYLLWVDSGLEVVTPDWIEHLLLYCEQSQIACAAPLLVNRDGTVWHAGLVLGMNGIVGYPMQGSRADSDGYAGSLSCAREVSCVSGECLMISRQKLEAMGGLVPYYRDSLYDGADLSLRACTAGLRNIATPRAVLRRVIESTAEGSALDSALFADRWGAMTKYGDRFHNPNFHPTSPGYEPKKLALATMA